MNLSVLFYVRILRGHWIRPLAMQLDNSLNSVLINRMDIDFRSVYIEPAIN